MHNLLTFHYENLEQRGSTHAIICEKKNIIVQYEND